MKVYIVCCQSSCATSTRVGRDGEVRTLGGLQMSQMWTGNPFFALLTRPVFGVILGAYCDVAG